jgi:Outer membrane efflux protein
VLLATLSLLISPALASATAKEDVLENVIERAVILSQRKSIGPGRLLLRRHCLRRHARRSAQVSELTYGRVEPLSLARESREQQQKLVAVAEDAARLAQMRYQAGATSYLEVLTTDSNLLSARLNLVNSREGEAQSLVQLYEALGGGWEQ